ncbi:MAG: ABC transporter substrate-binding protein [Actinomycetota bacterium]
MFRDRVVVIFMTLASVMTLVFGSLLIADLTRKEPTQSVIVSGGTSGTQGSEAATPGTAGGEDTTASVAPGTQTGTTAGKTGGSTGGSKVTTGKVSSAGGAAQGVTDKEIRVGGIFDITGPLDSTVERDTVRAYFNMVNAQGGVNGRNLTLIPCDSKYDANEAMRCAEKLVNTDKVLTIVGSLAVQGENDAVPAINQMGVPYIGGLGAPNAFKYPLSYPVSADFVTYGTAMGTHAARDLGFKKPGIVVLDVPFIAPALNSMLDALHKYGVKEATVQKPTGTQPDYTTIVLAMRQAGADSIMTVMDPYSYQRLFDAMQRQNFKPPLLGAGMTKGNLQTSYGEPIKGSQSLSPFLEPLDPQYKSNPAIRLYLDTVRKYFPNQVSKLDIYTQQSWTAAALFVDVIKRVGANVSRKALVDGLNATKNFDIGWTVPLSFQAGNSHDPNRCFRWMKNDNGTWNTTSDWNCF